MPIFFKKIDQVCSGCHDSEMERCPPINLYGELCPCSKCILQTNCSKTCDDLLHFKMYHIMDLKRMTKMDFERHYYGIMFLEESHGDMKYIPYKSGIIHEYHKSLGMDRVLKLTIKDIHIIKNNYLEIPYNQSFIMLEYNALSRDLQDSLDRLNNIVKSKSVDRPRPYLTIGLAIFALYALMKIIFF